MNGHVVLDATDSDSIAYNSDKTDGNLRCEHDHIGYSVLYHCSVMCHGMW